MTALLNSISSAEYICTNYSGIIDFNIVDEDGYTARDIAELVGSDGVANVISSYMVHDSKNEDWGYRFLQQQQNQKQNPIQQRFQHKSLTGRRSGDSSIRDDKKEEREEDYVYDVYCLKQSDGDDENENDDHEVNNTDGRTEMDVESRVDDEPSAMAQQQCNPNGYQREDVVHSNENDDDEDGAVLVQMKGGVGYWNEKGELILETAPDFQDSQFDIEDEDEYDSNCEEYDGNDYPDDDDDDDCNNDNEMFENNDVQHSMLRYGK